MKTTGNLSETEPRARINKTNRAPSRPGLAKQTSWYLRNPSYIFTKRLSDVSEDRQSSMADSLGSCVTVRIALTRWLGRSRVLCSAGWLLRPWLPSRTLPPGAVKLDGHNAEASAEPWNSAVVPSECTFPAAQRKNDKAGSQVTEASRLSPGIGFTVNYDVKLWEITCQKEVLVIPVFIFILRSKPCAIKKSPPYHK